MDNKQWFTQKEMAEILGTTVSNICIHLTEIMNDYVVDVMVLPVMCANGKVYNCKHYDLEMLCNIGVKSRNPEAIKEMLSDRGIVHPANFKFPAKEYRFKELIKKAFDGVYIFQHQYMIGKYFVDFYFPTHGLVVEYDEIGHKSYKNDNEREIDIARYRGVNHIIRVHEGSEVEGLNSILRYLVA